MAEFAAGFLIRFMDDARRETSLIRSMRIMTSHAVRIGDIILLMGCKESFCCHFMAGSTQDARFLGDQRSEIAQMRLMADQALPFVHRRVLQLFIENLHLSLMTLGAEQSVGFPENLRLNGSVRFMTADAVPLLNWLVEIFPFFLFGVIVMAFIAEIN